MINGHLKLLCLGQMNSFFSLSWRSSKHIQLEHPQIREQCWLASRTGCLSDSCISFSLRTQCSLVSKFYWEPSVSSIEICWYIENVSHIEHISSLPQKNICQNAGMHVACEDFKRSTHCSHQTGYNRSPESTSYTIYGCIPVSLIFVIILDPPNVNALGGLQSRPMINQ